MDVSIIIPAFNAEATIIAAIQSAFVQNVRLEVVVVDDGSSDSTFSRCKSLADPRILIQRIEHRGPGAARNIGLQIARGKWVALLDADDVMLPGRLSRLLEIGDNADIIADNLWLRQETTHQLTLFIDEPLSGEVSEIDLAYFLNNNQMFGIQPSLGYLKPIIRKSVLERYDLKYREDLRIGEDFALVALLLAENTRYIRHHSAGYIYQKHSKSTSHRLQAQDIRGLIDFDREIGRRFPLSIAERLALEGHFASLKMAYDFSCALDDMASGKILRGVKRLLRNPDAVPLLKYPIKSRMNRIRSHFSKKDFASLD